MIAVVTVPQTEGYGGRTFGKGLSKLGYDVRYKYNGWRPKPGDVLVIWNRPYGTPLDHLAVRAERAGATVLVVENGYLGRKFNGTNWYALARGQHNGPGFWIEGGPERWDSLGVEIAPWRAVGREVVVLAARGLGSGKTREPRAWAGAALALLRKAGYDARIRPHPKATTSPSLVPLADDLANAKAVVTWGSTSGLKALLMGIPVFYGLKNWIGASSASPFNGLVGVPYTGDRLPTFRRLAWAMHSREELETGDPFQWLLSSPSSVFGDTHDPRR